MDTHTMQPAVVYLLVDARYWKDRYIIKAEAIGPLERFLLVVVILAVIIIVTLICCYK